MTDAPTHIEKRTYWMLSFAGHNRFLGGLVIEADHLVTAVTYATLAGLNPGGEILGVSFRATSVDPKYLNRLLNEEETWTMPEPEGVELVEE